MDFSLSEEQRLLAEALGRYLEESVSPARVREIAASDEGHDAGVWSSIAELGVAGMLVPEEHGGSGLRMLDAVVAAESFGYHCAPVPFLSACMASIALLRGSTQEQKESWLPRIAHWDAGLSIDFRGRITRRE